MTLQQAAMPPSADQPRALDDVGLDAGTQQRVVAPSLPTTAYLAAKRLPPPPASHDLGWPKKPRLNSVAPSTSAPAPASDSASAPATNGAGAGAGAGATSLAPKSAIAKRAGFDHNKHRMARLTAAVSTILDCIGEDPGRDGLRDTPMRYAKALLTLTEGYSKTVEQVVGDAVFEEEHHEPVIVRDISVHSLCEHHLLPFHGVCHVAYIPSGAVIGLSKIARIVDVFARRLQVQERLSRQVADAVQRVTGAGGVMVLVSSTHQCMSMRGVQRVGALTTTTATTGRYAAEAELRAEFLSIVGGGSSGRV